jgi:hypothetical protein
VSSTGDLLRKKLRPRVAAQGASVSWWGAEADRLMRDLFKTSFDVDVVLREVTGVQLSAEAALQGMEPVSLPFLLGMPGEARGLFTMDGALIDAVIELQMLGKVMGMERLDRPITAIDAGLSEVFVRAALAAFKAGPAGLSGLTTLGPQQDRAALRLALGEGRYDVLRAQIDLGPGIKTGVCSIWLPAEPARVIATPRKAASGAMKAVLDRCKVDLTAQISGIDVSALALARLTQGSLLPLPMSAISEVELRDCTDAPFAQARLGRLHGARALRITQMQGGQAGAAGAVPQTPTQIAFEDGDVATKEPAVPALEKTSDMGLSAPERGALAASGVEGEDPVPKAG